ncbi:MAG: hypothetical protein ACOC1K_04645, partial [Nanoarchaeota archaeon]
MDSIRITPSLIGRYIEPFITYYSKLINLDRSDGDEYQHCIANLSNIVNCFKNKTFVKKSDQKTLNPHDSIGKSLECKIKDIVYDNFQQCFYRGQTLDLFFNNGGSSFRIADFEDNNDLIKEYTEYNILKDQDSPFKSCFLPDLLIETKDKFIIIDFKFTEKIKTINKKVVIPYVYKMQMAIYNDIFETYDSINSNGEYEISEIMPFINNNKRKKKKIKCYFYKLSLDIIKNPKPFIDSITKIKETGTVPASKDNNWVQFNDKSKKCIEDLKFFYNKKNNFEKCNTAIDGNSCYFGNEILNKRIASDSISSRISYSDFLSSGIFYNCNL